MFWFWKKKKKNVHNPSDDIQMMVSFNANGGYLSNLDVMAWQLGWKVAKNSTELSPDKDFQSLYYGSSPFPFDEKSFKLAWCVSKNFSSSSYKIPIPVS